MISGKVVQRYIYGSEIVATILDITNAIEALGGDVFQIDDLCIWYKKPVDYRINTGVINDYFNGK